MLCQSMWQILESHGIGHTTADLVKAVDWQKDVHLLQGNLKHNNETIASFSQFLTCVIRPLRKIDHVL